MYHYLAKREPPTRPPLRQTRASVRRATGVAASSSRMAQSSFVGVSLRFPTPLCLLIADLSSWLQKAPRRLADRAPSVLPSSVVPGRASAAVESERAPPTMEERRAVLYRMTQLVSGSPARLDAYERELSFADALGLDPPDAAHLRGILLAGQQVEMQRDALNTVRAALWLQALRASGLSDYARIPFPFDEALPWDDMAASDVDVAVGSSYVPPSVDFVAKARAAADLEALAASVSGSASKVVEVGGLTLGGEDVV